MLVISQVFKTPQDVKITVSQKLTVKTVKDIKGPVTLYLVFDKDQKLYRLQDPLGERGFSHVGAVASTTQPAARTVTFDVHGGYFVSNKFEPKEPASFVVIADRKAFDRTFGVAFVMGNKSHRLPANAFDTKMVVGVIKRGKATWDFKVEGVAAQAGVLTVQYSAKSTPSDSAEFACPLIVSIAKGGYSMVEFIENGKRVQRVEFPATATQPAAKTAPTTEPSASTDTFEIKCRKPEDRVTVALADGNVIFTVTSPRGIGGATIERKGETWPQAVVLRLHLRGLESLAISCGEMKLSASVLSHSGNARLLHLGTNGKEGPQLTKDSPHWTAVRVLDASGKPITGLPDKGGYFELAIPTALLEKAKVMKVEWVDFYRG